MQRAKPLCAVATLALLVGRVVAADDELDAWKLNNRCSKIGVIVDSVEEQPHGDDEVGITLADLQYAAESRLRGAGVFEDGSVPEYLYVEVAIYDRAFAISVSLRRLLDDTGHGRLGVVQVWSDEAIGTHSGDKQYVLGGVSRYLDRFLTLYLRSNEAWCDMLESGDFSGLLQHEELTLVHWRRKGIIDPTATEDEIEQRAWSTFGHKYPLSRVEFRSQFLGAGHQSGERDASR